MFKSSSVSGQSISIGLSFGIHITLQTCADSGPRLFLESLQQFYSCHHGIHVPEHAEQHNSRTDLVPISLWSGAAPLGLVQSVL